MKRWRVWLHWQRSQGELREEMAAHQAMKREELAATGLEGAALEAAVGRAMGRELLAAEDARAVWLWTWIEALGGSLRQAGRGLRRAPAFTLVAVVTLALGIGANTAIFSVVEAVLLRPLPYPEADRIVGFTLSLRGTPQTSLTVPQIFFLRDHARSFSALAGYRGLGTTELDHGGATDWAEGLDASDGFFRVLGASPVLGRGFERGDTSVGAQRVMVLSNALWRSAFHSAPEVLGQVVRVNGAAATIIGVLPGGFRFNEPNNFSAPPAFFESLPGGSGLGNDGLNTDAIARLQPGVSLGAAQAEVASLAATTPSLLGDWPGSSLGVAGYHALATRYASTSLWLLFGAVALLLLIACVNVASLVMARALARGRETALRRALGAGRVRLLIHFLAEGMILAVAGAVAGWVLALGLLRLLGRQLPTALALTPPTHFDGVVFSFTAAVAVLVAVAFSLTSLFQTRRASLLPAAYGAPGGREWMVGFEIALALLLLAGAGLLIRSLSWLQNQPLGFDPQGATYFHTDYAATQVSSAAVALRLNQQILQRLQTLPGVEKATLTSTAPLRGQSNLPIEPAAHPELGTSVELRAVSPGFFSALRIPLRSGRGFSESDTATSPRVALVSEALAEKWYGAHPLGGQLRVGVLGGKEYVPAEMAVLREIVGVVGDIRAVRLDRPPRLTVYVPATQLPSSSNDWVVRETSTTDLEAQIRSAVASVSPATRISDLQPYPKLLGAVLAQPAFLARLLGLLALLALILTAVGLYGVLAYAVTQRTREIGIRMALGADAARVRRSVIGRGLVLAAVGIVAGGVAAAPLAGLLRGLLYGVQPLDPLSLAGATGVLVVSALAASWIPALRATRVDPARALRAD